MANDFSGDSSVKALWSFEPGALTVDSIGGNTLTASSSPPTSDAADFMEGIGSANFVAASNQSYAIPDASLATGFPLKNGDTTKQITICGRFKAAGWTSAGTMIISKRSSYPALSTFSLMQWSAGELHLTWFYNATGGYQDWAVGLTCQTGRWYSYGLVLDGVNKIAILVVWDESTGNLVLTWRVTPTNALNVCNSAFNIGCCDVPGICTFSGKIDEVVVFNRLLNYSEILAIRQGTYSGTGLPLLANSFTGDSRFNAWWKFDTTATILNDAIGGNTLTAVSASPYSDGFMFLSGMGTGGCVFNRSTNGATLSRTDTDLSAGFPLKSGDAVKQISVCCWVPPHYSDGNGGYNNLLWQKDNLSLWYGPYQSGTPVAQLFVKWGSETFNLGIGLTHNCFWHIAVVADGVNKTLNVRVYNTGSATATNYTFTPTATLTVTNGPWYVLGNGGNYDEGNNIDELIVAAGLLSDAEIDKIRAGIYSFVQTYDLTTIVAAASAVSAPIAAIARPLASSPAAVSAVSSPILAITRALQATVAAGSATSTPSLLILRALISAIYGVSDVGTPNLAVVRPLLSSPAAISVVSTPSLAVQRALASLAAVMSETTDIDLLLHGILDITTAVAAQSQVSSPALNVARPLDSSFAGQTQTSAAVLAVLRALVATIAVEAQTPEITLKVLRDLATAISGQSAVSTPTLESICSLITEAHAVTDTSAAALAVLRDLVATIAAQSTLSDFGLAMGVPRDLITLVAALTYTSDIELILAFHESLLAKAKRYYGPVSAVDLKVAALQWVETEEDKEANLPGDQYNDHVF